MIFKLFVLAAGGAAAYLFLRKKDDPAVVSAQSAARQIQVAINGINEQIYQAACSQAMITVGRRPPLMLPELRSSDVMDAATKGAIANMKAYIGRVAPDLRGKLGLDLFLNDADPDVDPPEAILLALAPLQAWAASPTDPDDHVALTAQLGNVYLSVAGAF
jgi:hypothetical protein